MPNGTHWHNVIFAQHWARTKAIKDEARREIARIEERCAHQSHEELTRYFKACHESFKLQSNPVAVTEWVVVIYQKEHNAWAFLAGEATFRYVTLTIEVAHKFPNEAEAYEALRLWFEKPNVVRSLSVVIPPQLLE